MSGSACVLPRKELLRRGALLAVAGVGVGALAAPAEAAGIPDSDLAYLRLLVAAELLKADFEARALASGKLEAPEAALVRRMRADDGAHYKGLASLLNSAGQAPATADDIDFRYPRGSFTSQRSIGKLAWRLTNLGLGAYLGAVESVETAQVRLPLGQIAANEAQQLSALAALLGKPTIGSAFAGSLQIDAVSNTLDVYER
jgi:hypothetical protein